MKKFIIAVALSLSLVFALGCNQEAAKSADAIDKEKTEALAREGNRQAGMPNIVNFQQKKLMKLIYEKADQADLLSYVYLKSDYSGKLIFLAKGVGYGVPFSAQYTNPMKIAARGVNYGYAILPQPDPNGLFMPTSSSATWLLMLNPKDGEPDLVYLEPEIVVSPFPIYGEDR